MAIVIPRFAFNFRNKCNINCRYCYIPFIDENCGTLELWKRIVDEMQKYNPSLITFGGGDPFNYTDFRQLLIYCDNVLDKNIKIHVDTNGIGIKHKDYNVINNCVDVIGFPIDGTEDIHSLIRKNSIQYNLILKHLSALRTSTTLKKINTVLMSENINDVHNLVPLIQKYDIARWYIYQYWHFRGINPNLPLLDKTIVEAKINLIRKQVGNKLIYSDIDSRKDSYVFVSSIGHIYTIINRNKYIELGTIFDDDLDIKINKYVNYYALQQRTFEKLN
jgi:MoaA/NifB/PqqE/SkfB family radical SAM enzyme